YQIEGYFSKCAKNIIRYQNPVQSTEFPIRNPPLFLNYRYLRNRYRKWRFPEGGMNGLMDITSLKTM
ncbi:MAG TPA: hypothetical protein PK178_09790, partial [Smithellaceae bacterium]|nr:hypothetical protein [Smithellaceae bacterium]